MIRGADYSNNQTQAQMIAHLDANPEIRFALLKVSQGIGFVDQTAQEKTLELVRRGNRVGYYHYLDPVPGHEQWDHFERCLNQLRKPDPFIVACDYEGELLKDPVFGDQIARGFIKRGQARGFRVGKYGSSRVSQAKLGEDWRWVAWWAPKPPPFKWDIWQFTSKPLDLDVSKFATPEALAFWWRNMGRRTQAQTRKVWYAYDPITGQTLGPENYLGIGARITKHLRTYPATLQLTVRKLP